MVIKSALPFQERVGKVLLEAEFVTAAQLDQARQASKESGEGLLDTLVKLGMVAIETLMTVLSFNLRIPVVDLKSVVVDLKAVRRVPAAFAREHHILPVAFEDDGSLRVATMEPNDFQLGTQLSFMTKRSTKFALALHGSIDKLIEQTYASLSAAKAPWTGKILVRGIISWVRTRLPHLRRRSS